MINASIDINSHLHSFGLQFNSYRQITLKVHDACHALKGFKCFMGQRALELGKDTHTLGKTVESLLEVVRLEVRGTLL